MQAASKTTKNLAQRARGSRERFFGPGRFVLLLLLRLRLSFRLRLRYRSGRDVFRLRYVTVAGVKRPLRPGRHFPVPY